MYIKGEKNCETFLYTKSKTPRKKQDNFRYVLIYKKRDTHSCLGVTTTVDLVHNELRM